MKKAKYLIIFVIGICLLSAGNKAEATVIGFVNNPTTNSVDWTNEINSLGGIIDIDINFNTLTIGSTFASNASAYAVSEGVSFSQIAGMGTIANSAGPGVGSSGLGPFSAGEGVHPISRFVLSDSSQFFGAATSSFVTSFASPVLGVGLFTIDAYLVGYPFYIAAYTGTNATGTLLGTFGSGSQGYNFQGFPPSAANSLYYMGVVSTDNNIGSLKFYTANRANINDTFGIDNIRYATKQVQAVPEPTTILLLGLGLIGLAGVRRKFKK